MLEQETPKLSKAFSIGIIIIQLFDIVIHAATDQLEPLRVVSNLIIMVWIVIVLKGKFIERIFPLALGSIGFYLVFNLIFLIREGMTNPNTGEARTMLFLLVLLTTVLSIVLIIQLKKKLVKN